MNTTIEPKEIVLREKDGQVKISLAYIAKANFPGEFYRLPYDRIAEMWLNEHAKFVNDKLDSLEKKVNYITREARIINGS